MCTCCYVCFGVRMCAYVYEVKCVGVRMCVYVYEVKWVGVGRCAYVCVYMKLSV